MDTSLEIVNAAKSWTFAWVEIPRTCERVWTNDQISVYLFSRNEPVGSLPQQSARTSPIPGNVLFRAFCVASPCVDDPERWWAINGPSMGHRAEIWDPGFRQSGRVGRCLYTTFEAETELDNIRVALPPHSAAGAKEMYAALSSLDFDLLVEF